MTPEVTTSQSMSDRIKEFRSDPEKMEVTSKFVNEVVEKAKCEALRRMKERDREKSSQRVPDTNFEGDLCSSLLPLPVAKCSSPLGVPAFDSSSPFPSLRHCRCNLQHPQVPREPGTNWRRLVPLYGSRRKRGRWHSRARGFFSRILASLCFCSPETHV